MASFFRHILLPVIALMLAGPALSQLLNDAALAKKYPFIHASLNRIQQPGSLDGFYQKLEALQQDGRGVVSVVHIGDSHIQPGFTDQIVRRGLQQQYGNAGRGIVFPYQLALSNSPDDTRASSPVHWNFNRLAHPEIATPVGVSGYGIVNSNKPEVSLRIHFRGGNAGDNAFTQLSLFASPSAAGNWRIHPAGADSTMLERNTDLPFLYQTRLSEPCTDFTLRYAPADSCSLFGVMLQSDSAGVLYHTIGVNGARADHYNRAEQFWQQLPVLNADLFIVSLGTNDALMRPFSEQNLIRELSRLVTRLREAAPDAAILFATAPLSYRGRYPNSQVPQFNQALTRFCQRENIACWDLYGITSRHRSSLLQVMNRDRIHYTAEGYRVMGNLLLNALSKKR